MFSLVVLVQTKFVGSLGASAVAAVGAGQRVFFALQAVFTAIGVGTTALVARSWGAGQQEEAGRITITSLLVGAAAGALITVTGIVFSRHIADLFGLDDYTGNLASRNIFWLSAFICGFAIDIIFSGALRAEIGRAHV